MLVVLKVIHLYALILGAMGGMGTGILMSRADGPPSAQVVSVLKLFKTFGIVSIALLWLTGLLLVWIEFGTLALGLAFYVKLVAATVLTALIFGSASIAAKARGAGAPPDRALMEKLGKASALMSFVAIVCAVIAFN